MSKDNATNSAFPMFNQHGECIHDSAGGLTKLEFFAAMAMQGLAANSWLTEEQIKAAQSGVTPDELPFLAVKMAEGILAELSRSR